MAALAGKLSSFVSPHMLRAANVGLPPPSALQGLTVRCAYRVLSANEWELLLASVRPEPVEGLVAKPLISFKVKVLRQAQHERTEG